MAQGFTGWGDMSQFAANGFANASGAPGVTAPTLSPYHDASAAGVAGYQQQTAAGTLANQQQFANPYTQQVVDTSLAGYDQNAAMARAAMAANGARNGAFGGSRYGVAEGILGGQQALGRGQLESGLRSDAWNSSMGAAQHLGDVNQNTQLQHSIAQAGLANQTSIANAQGANQLAMHQADLRAQADQFNQQRQLQALSLLGDTANSYAGNDRADLSLIADLGAQQRAIEAQQLMAPATQLGLEGQFYGDIPVGAFTGQTIDSTGTSSTKQSGGLLGSILGGLAAGAGSAIASDRRLKTNIARVGTEPDGLGVYDYEYVWGGGKQRGVMADEVEALRPWALGPIVHGFATVNYGRL